MSSVHDNSEDNTYKESKKNYRTRKKAGNVATIPDAYAIITQKDYQNAVGLFPQGNAFLQPISDGCGLNYTNGKLYIKGLPASHAELKNYYTDQVPKNIDLPLLRLFYNIILANCQDALRAGNCLNEIYTVYIPDFIRSAGRISIGEEDSKQRDYAKAIMASIMSFHSIIGIVDGDCLPILLYTGQNRKKNTISFMSPYMNRVIENVFAASICKEKDGRNWIPETKAAYSYLINQGILMERNKKAVEIVHIIVTLIEQAGNSEPHISAKTIVERNIMLRESIKKSDRMDKNKMLKRAFSKAWELLKTQTKLQATYCGIELPDPKNVPTMSTLESTVYTFRHAGKNKNP